MPLNRLKDLSWHLQGLIAGRLWLKILIGMVLGVAAGIALGPEVGLLDSETSEVVGDWLVLPGNLFLALIQMIVIPLVFASIVLGIASNEGLQELKRMGPWIALFFLVMTVIAIVMGMSAASLVNPGSYIEEAIIEMTAGSAETPGASVGTPSTPGVGIMILATILRGVGIPLNGIALIIGVDRILDMSRTAVNVTGDLSACAVMERWFGGSKAEGQVAPRPEQTGDSAAATAT